VGKRRGRWSRRQLTVVAARTVMGTARGGQLAAARSNRAATGQYAGWLTPCESTQQGRHDVLPGVGVAASAPVGFSTGVVNKPAAPASSFWSFSVTQYIMGSHIEQCVFVPYLCLPPCRRRCMTWACWTTSPHWAAASRAQHWRPPRPPRGTTPPPQQQQQQQQRRQPST
jgi:hypothetical protein